MNIEQLFEKTIGLEKYNKFLLYLDKTGSGFDEFLIKCVQIFAIVSVIITIAFVFSVIPVYLYLIIILLGFPLILMINYIIVLYNEEQRQKQIEESLPDFLLQASLFPKGSDITVVMNFIAKQNFGYLSQEFRIALDQINKGFPVENALKGILSRNKNKLLHRVINLLIIGYRSGKDMSYVLSKLSQDLLKTQSVDRDRYSGLAIQKYTLLIASCVLVPLVLSWVSNIVSNINLGMFADSGIITINTELIKYTKYAIYIYLFEFSIIASIFIAIIDGNWKKFVLYMLIIVPCAYLVFFL